MIKSSNHSTLLKDAKNMQEKCEVEINKGLRFSFGQNWTNFLSTIDDQKIQAAMQALQHMLQCKDLVGKRFLDIGCGSGLSSLAARKLGAQVCSFDYDMASVACTEKLKNRYYREDLLWTIQLGNVLDRNYLKSLGEFDIVYSWGALHHTGDLWSALENVIINLEKNAKLYIAIYNDRGWASKYWKFVKRKYCTSLAWKIFLFTFHLPYPLGASVIKRMFDKRIFRNDRGMSLFYDYLDWLGGYPFEVASPQHIESFYNQRNCHLVAAKITPRGGCNEFIFSR